MRLNNFFACICVVLFCNHGNAQAPMLTLEQAIETGLKNHFDILLVKNDAQIASNNNTAGNAGMLPKVDLIASVGLANNATHQEFSSGLIVDKKGVSSNNINAGVYLAWTVFDGMRMFAAKGRLNTLDEMGKLSLKIQIENSLSDIIVTYYNIVRQKQLIIGLNENINISKERLSIAQKKFDIGSGAKLDQLQAQIDLNAQSAVIIRQESALSQLKISLNQLLARAADADFDVSDSIPIQFRLNYDALKSSLPSTNNQMLFAQKNISVSSFQLREAESQWYPRLNFNANYLFARSENQAGFALFNQNLGLNLGLTASWTVFNGFNIKNQVKNAKLEVSSANLQYNKVRSLAELQLLASFRNYQYDAQILKLQEENVKLAKEAVNIALERFRIGTSNSLELKEIQRSYDDALVNLAEARYNAKVSETNLMKLNGDLVK